MGRKLKIEPGLKPGEEEHPVGHGAIDMIKDIRVSKTNGDIPVKYEYADLFYDVNDCKFYMIVKIGNKKFTLFEESE